MNYRKALITIAAVCTCSINLVWAEAPELIHPAKQQELQTLPADGIATETKDKTLSKTISTKIQYNNYRKKRKIAPKTNYTEIEKLVEYGYYDKADNLIDYALNHNSKNIQAKALQVVSLAKQYKLDPAQKQLDALLKVYPKNSDLHYAQGIVYFKRTTSSNMFFINQTDKLLSDAKNEFEKAIDLDKKSYQAYNALGVLELREGNRAEAKKLFQKSIEINPKYSTAIDNLGTISYLEGKYSEAEKSFNKALLYNTQNTTAMYHLAQVSMQKQDYGNALIILNNALAINQNSESIYNLMGEAYEKQGNQAAAINAYRKSIMVKPEFALPYLNLANVYDQRGDGEFAIEQLKTALSCNPDFYDAKLKVADISLSSGKYTQAIDYYSSLIGVEGYSDDALKGLANTYFEQAQISSSKALISSNGDFFKAFDLINKAIDSNNQDLELHLAKLKLAKITNQPVLSHNVLQDIIKAPDGNLINLITKGEAYLTLGDYKNAEKYFDLAATSTQNVQDDLYLAEIYIYHKQYDNAVVVLNKILKTEPDNKQAVSDLEYIQKSRKNADNDFKSAQYFIKSGSKTVALEYLLRSLSLNPYNAKAHLLLAEIYEKQKDYNGAIANYKAYLNLEINPRDKKSIEKKIIRLENR